MFFCKSIRFYLNRTNKSSGLLRFKATMVCDCRTSGWHRLITNDINLIGRPYLQPFCPVCDIIWPSSILQATPGIHWRYSYRKFVRFLMAEPAEHREGENDNKHRNHQHISKSHPNTILFVIFIMHFRGMVHVHRLSHVREVSYNIWEGPIFFCKTTCIIFCIICPYSSL